MYVLFYNLHERKELTDGCGTGGPLTLEICFLLLLLLLFMISNPKVEFYFQLEASKRRLEISRFRNRVFKGLKFFYVYLGGFLFHFKINLSR